MAKYEGIEIRRVKADAMNKDSNTTVGLTANGSVHPVPTKSKDGKVKNVPFFTNPGEKLPRQYYEMLIENADLAIDGLEGEQLIRAKARIEEIRTYLKLSKTGTP